MMYTDAREQNRHICTGLGLENNWPETDFQYRVLVAGTENAIQLARTLESQHFDDEESPP